MRQLVTGTILILFGVAFAMWPAACATDWFHTEIGVRLVGLFGMLVGLGLLLPTLYVAITRKPAVELTEHDIVVRSIAGSRWGRLQLWISGVDLRPRWVYLGSNGKRLAISRLTTDPSEIHALLDRLATNSSDVEE